MGTAGAEINWRLKTPQTVEFILALLSRLRSAQQQDRILARLKLKGNFIWSQADPNVYLDGEGFGMEQKTASATIGVRLPQSGNGKRGGDFDMWFWLGLPVTLSGFTIAPTSVNVGQNATGTLTLSGPALAGGAAVTLTGVVLDAAGAQVPGATIATFPQTVTIAAGQSSATFPITNTSLPPNTGGPITLQITARFADKTLTASMNVGRSVSLSGLSLNPTAILGGPSSLVTGTVTLNGPAPAGGASISLASNNANAARPQIPTVTVAANQTSANFSIVTVGQQTNAAIPVQITATFGGATQQATLTVLGPKLA